MNSLFAIELNLSPITISAIVISSVGFLVMFLIASAKGEYQDLVQTTLKNDSDLRNQTKKDSN